MPITSDQRCYRLRARPSRLTSRHGSASGHSNPAACMVALLGVVFLALPLHECHAEVTVEGGMDPGDRHFYSWVVTNGNKSPIVSFQISHYQGMVFTVPPDWSKTVTERALGTGKVDVGSLIATAPPGGGIRTGQSATFSIKLHVRGASAQLGTVLIRFADNGSLTITGVEYPGQEPWLTQHMTLVGMIGLAVVALVIQFVRSRLRTIAPKSQEKT